MSDYQGSRHTTLGACCLDFVCLMQPRARYINDSQYVCVYVYVCTCSEIEGLRIFCSYSFNTQLFALNRMLAMLSNMGSHVFFPHAHINININIVNFQLFPVADAKLS